MLYLLISFFTCLFIITIILKTRISTFAVDKPNHRSLHTKLTPRTGGIAIMLGVFASWITLSVAWYWLILPLILVLTSLVDDICHLSVKWRLLAQLIVVAIFVCLIVPNFSWWIAVLIVMLTWMTNLYNFMDGSDGLAGGMGLFGFMAYAIAAFIFGHEQLALMCASVSLACLAFLLFNFHPAKIFMGDSGSIPLGFLAGAIGFFGWQQQIWPAWFPILVFSPFIVDATVTLIKRLINKEKIWQAHKSHYYQRLIQLGWGHRKTALAEYILMFFVGLTAVLFIRQESFFVASGLLFWLVAYVLGMRYADKRWQDFKMNHHDIQSKT